MDSFKLVIQVLQIHLMIFTVTHLHFKLMTESPYQTLVREKKDFFFKLQNFCNGRSIKALPLPPRL